MTRSTTTPAALVRLPAALVLTLTLALGLAACVSGTAAVYPGQNYPPTDPREVQVYRFFPDAPFTKVGEVTATGQAGTDWSKFQDELKRKAASIGGQAVVIVGQRNRLVDIYESPSQFQTLNPGGALARQSFFFPGQVYPQEETHLLGIVLRFPEGGLKGAPPEGARGGQGGKP